MAFTATIKNIKRGDGQIQVIVGFADSVSGWTNEDMFKYNDDGVTNQAQVISDITAKGTFYKNNLAQNNILQSKIGTVITI